MENLEMKLEKMEKEMKMETKSVFGPHFRKWLAMKRALRLVHEEVYTNKIYVPRIQYKLKKYWIDLMYEDVAGTEEDLYKDFDLIVYQTIMHRDHHPLINLLKDGLNVNYRLGRRQRTLLHQATLKGDPEMVDILLQNGANINALDNNGDNALYFAINLPLQFHKLVIIEKLLEHGVKVNHKNHDGWTPLHRACFLGEPKLVELILAHKSKVYALTYKENVLPLQLVKKNHDEIQVLFSSQFRRGSSKVKKDHHLMWAHIISRDFVETLFEIVEPNCVTCKRKTRVCGKMKKENYRYWLLIHNKKPR